MLTATDVVLDAFDTDEREAFCSCMDQSLTEHGVDAAALTTRHGLGRYRLADRWWKW